MNGNQNSVHYVYSVYLEALEGDLQDQLAQPLYHEELLWLQKLRGKLFTDRAKNAKYYHLKTIIHRRRNKIMALKEDNRGWECNSEKTKRMVMHHFSKLFKEGQETREPIVSFFTYLAYLEDHRVSLSIVPSRLEI